MHSGDITLPLAIVQLLCMTGASEAIRCMRVAVNRQSLTYRQCMPINECLLTKLPGGLQTLHSADEDHMSSKVKRMVEKAATPVLSVLCKHAVG